MATETTATHHHGAPHAAAHAGTHGHGERHHPYHLVDPSPWPFVGTVGAFVMAVGLVMWMHEMAGGPWVILAGTALVLFTMFGW